jgi:4-amino-4-deoxy-L-arabinose transferase-like glycosyltransferase
MERGTVAEIISLDIINFISTRPEVLFLIAFMGAVCVIGIVDYLRCFFEKKKNAIRWVVLFCSLFVAIILSPITHKLITTIIILWLLILALATIGKKYIIDAIGKLIEGAANKITGNSNNQNDEKGQ